MTTRTKQLAALLGSGVVLASGAYALGSQAGNGGAQARDSTPAGGSAQVSDRGVARGLRRGGDFGLDALASKLGVSPTALRDALNAMRTAKTPDERRAELVQALATALGKPVDQVRSAVDSVLPDRGARKDDFGAALAKELGVDTAKVQAAFDNLRSDVRNGARPANGPDRRDALVNAIASATGVDTAQVRAALQKLRAGFGGDRGARRDDVRQRLATALGVTTAQLDTALGKVRTQARDQFATELAQRLHIDVQKAKDALPSFGFAGRRHG